jgi:hypothetical protein
MDGRREKETKKKYCVIAAIYRPHEKKEIFSLISFYCPFKRMIY